MQNNIYYYFSYSPEKPILALQKQVAENLENAPLLIRRVMERMEKWKVAVIQGYRYLGVIENMWRAKRAVMVFMVSIYGRLTPK